MDDLQPMIEQLQDEGFWVVGPDLADVGDTIRLLDNADYTVIARRPHPPAELPGQASIYSYDPVTGQLIEQCAVPLRPRP